MGDLGRNIAVVSCEVGRGLAHRLLGDCCGSLLLEVCVEQLLAVAELILEEGHEEVLRGELNDLPGAHVHRLCGPMMQRISSSSSSSSRVRSQT